MAYAVIADVQALIWARSLGVGSNPGPSQVQTYINMTAGEIDAILTTRGISVPVNTASYPEANALLKSVNAKGAVAMVEEASPNSINIDRARAAYDRSMEMLAAAKFSFDADLNQERSQPRGPFLTYQPSGDTYDPTLADGVPGDGISQTGVSNNRARPFFSRSMRFLSEPADWDDAKCVWHD